MERLSLESTANNALHTFPSLSGSVGSVARVELTAD